MTEAGDFTVAEFQNQINHKIKNKEKKEKWDGSIG